MHILYMYCDPSPTVEEAECVRLTSLFHSIGLEKQRLLTIKENTFCHMLLELANTKIA